MYADAACVVNTFCWCKVLVLCMQMLHVLLTRAVAVRCCMVLCMQMLHVLLTRAGAVYADAACVANECCCCKVLVILIVVHS